MSKTDASDQVKFLVCCIGHTSNGRPDFQLVANELEIVSKAAAQKRYERLLKSYGIKPGGGGNNGGSTPSGAEKKPVATRTPRKRKTNNNNNDDDDDEASLLVTPTPKKRARVAASKRSKKDVAVEDEDDDEIKPTIEGIQESRESPLSDAPSPSDLLEEY